MRRFDTRDEHHTEYTRDRKTKDAKPDKYNDPPHSRLFIVGGRSATEDDFREEFSKFGDIQDVYIVKDKVTREPKGVTYVKFVKTSAAACAMEDMNGKCIGDDPRPLKVMIAHRQDQGSQREENEEERLLRLFLVVPKTMDDDELRETFSEFGDIDNVLVIKDKVTKESKGVAYVKFYRMSHAAKAFEECDRSYKPVFAEPRRLKDKDPPSFGSRSGFRQRLSDAYGDYSPYVPRRDNRLAPFPMSRSQQGATRLTVIASSQMSQDQLWRLFDIVPGLDYCELKRDRKSQQSGGGVATVVYNNAQSARHAKEKLDGYEHAPGDRLMVYYDYENSSQLADMGHSYSGAAPYSQPPGGYMDKADNLVNQLAQTIAQASSLIQAAGGSQYNGQSYNSGGDYQTRDFFDTRYCSVKLPPCQPAAPADSPVAERLFVVCNPEAPPLSVLKDIFGRYGNLIDVFILNRKNHGYVKYACKQSADEAVLQLHLSEIMGSRMKVMIAEPPERSSVPEHKRMRMEAE